MEIPGYEVLQEVVRHGPYAVWRGRRRSNGEPVLLVVPERPDGDSESLERQFRLLRAFPIAGVPAARDILGGDDATCLVLEDRGLRPLRDILGTGPLELSSFFDVAVGLCAILDELHRRKLTHGTIAPSSVLVDAETWAVQLLAISGTAGSGHDAGMRASAAGTAYISPEQTARMNRTVDYRTDFYSLGLTLYEMLTGVPAFASEDSLELIHAHIARMPVPAAQLNPAVPEQLSRIVLRLLAKAAEDRYQSAAGLRHDLQRCRDAWLEGGEIPLFEPGRQDVSEQFLVSQKLYGRDVEVGRLLEIFDATCRGRTSLLLVAGYSGIGKTSLIHELYKPIIRKRGYFISGKFDQVVRNIPYGAFTQALRSLVWQLLTESEERLSDWRARMSAALGTNGGVLAEVIPEIELILGRQPPPPRLDPPEARNRFEYVFQSFVGAIAQEQHPLVVFLDDLQWVDAATLDLLHALLTGPDIRHLLLIGAYRDNEVDEGHLLTWAVNRLEGAGAHVPRLALGPLALPDLTVFLADTLHRERHQVAPLAALIQTKTDGNPFFVIQFMKTLEQEGHVRFDRGLAGWSFDMDAIGAAGITDNVVDLMTRKIRRLSPHGQRVLTLAACIGSRFDRETFLTVSRQRPADAAAGLAEALDAGLIRRLDDRDTYAFLHDRVQQAAYALIPDAEKKPIHLDVGRLLLADSETDVPDDRIFTIIQHLNIGQELIPTHAERVSLARLNLTAGRKAKMSAAYRAAAEYARQGIALLHPSQWQSDYDLMFPLHLELAECLYLARQFDEAETAFRLLLDRSAAPLDRAQVHGLRITLYENQSRWADALSAARDGLAPFGITFPEQADDKQGALEREVEAVQQLLGTRAIAALADLPVMTDPDMRMVMRLLTTAWAPAYISGDQVLARLISAAMVRLSLTYGNTEDSAYGYVTHAITVGPVGRDYRSAYEWGDLALTVNRRFDDVKRRAKIHQQFQAHVNLWRRPLETCIPHAREACRSGLESGDFTYAGYGAATEAWAAFLVSRDLDRFVHDFTPTLALLEKIRMTDFTAAHRIMLNWALALQGRTSDALSLSDATFDEQGFIDRYEGAAPFFLTFLYTAKLHLALLLERYEEAIGAADRARQVAVSGTIWPVLIDAWGGLADAASLDHADGGTRETRRARLHAARQSLAELADSCPENFRAFSLLLSAEIERVDGNVIHATRLCEDAVAYTRQTGNLQQEALASELCARTWLLRADEARAKSYMLDASRCYAAWGATAKVAQLEARHARLLGVRRSPVHSPAREDAEVERPGSVDISTVLKVARAIAVEIEIGGLLRKLMRLALENAGAQRGVFLHARDGALVIEADAEADRDLVRVGTMQSIDDADSLASTVVRYVQRTGQDVVTADAAADERFAGDAYIARAGARSILCVPVGHQGRLGGILYLENNLTTGAFTPARIEMMRILAAQTAIALENARLYGDMKSEVERRTAAERALRDALAEVEALKNRLEAENVYLQEEIRTQHNFNEIVGNSPVLLDALRKVERVAPTDSTVLIVGETGSGKELFARAVHSRSRRSTRPLVKVNCGAIAPGLVESELFGHVKGAFTGAIEKRVGRFELANGGTIFLDEIGELPLDAQVKLLRVLQEQEFEPVGSSRTVRVSVRVIAATNRDLEQAVRDGRFRADLLYRLNVFPIAVPALRDRPSDLGLLAGFFAAGLARRLGKPVQGFSARSMERIRQYSWPGNVRELQNVVERAAILAQGPVLEVEGTLLGGAGDAGAGASTAAAPIGTTITGESLDEVQRMHILSVLKSTGGVVEGAQGAASILGLHPNTLRSRMKKLGIGRNPG
jgi:predicted ATPase/transcriptional regulator with GAF, ATPase, and Fis domain